MFIPGSGVRCRSSKKENAEGSIAVKKERQEETIQEYSCWFGKAATIGGNYNGS